MSNTAHQFDAFLSYSHAADGKLAPALQHAIQVFSKPLFKRRVLRLFRDQTNLSASPGLWPNIEHALDGSRYFILLASPGAAQSKWVQREVEWWLAHRTPETLLIVLTQGILAWKESTNDFDWEKTDALPPTLKGVFAIEPLWVDLRWAKDEQNLSPRDPRFQHATAMFAAPMHGKTLDELIGEDVRQYRKTQVLIVVAVAVLTLLLSVSILATRVATKANENLQSKLNFIETVFPFFNTGGGIQKEEVVDDERPFFERLWSSIRANVLGPTEGQQGEEWIEWGLERLAVVDDCFNRDGGHVDTEYDCPQFRSEFDKDGLRTDIFGLNVMARSLVSSLNNGRVERLLADSKETGEGFDLLAGSKEKRRDALDTILGHVGILLPDKLWKQVKKVPKGDKRREESVFFFQLWRKPLDGSSEAAELILIQLVDGGYCGSRGCNSPIFGFLRVDETYKLVFVASQGGEIAMYYGGPGHMPQIFLIYHFQAGAYLQSRALSRYVFDGGCICYKPYLHGEIESADVQFNSQGAISVDDTVPEDLATTPKRERRNLTKE